MSFYSKRLLPKLLDSGMGKEEFEKLRPGAIELATGVVLEIGVGSGHNLPFYKNITQLYALDPSAELIALAKGRAEGLSFPVVFLNSSAESVPLPDASVDTVVSTWTLCSVSEVERVLTEVKRVLRSDGRFVFIDHGLSPNAFVGTLQHLLTPITKHFTGNCHLDRDIKKLIMEAGFYFNQLEQTSEKGRPLVFNNKGVGVIAT